MRLLLILWIGLTTAYGLTVTVDTLEDNRTGICEVGACSLYKAIQIAQPRDTINFSVNGTIVLTDTLIIDKAITIDGPGEENLSISGANSHMVFYVPANTGEFDYNLSINNLTIVDGNSSTEGGGLKVELNTALTLNHITFINNFAQDGGGAIKSMTYLHINSSTFSNNTSGFGGAVKSNGGITINDSIFLNNISTLDGGAIYIGEYSSIYCALSSIYNSEFKNNISSNSNNGGAIFVYGDDVKLCDLNISESLFSDNNATFGGGIYSKGTMSISQSLLTNNYADRNGGAIALRENNYIETTKGTLITNSTIHENSGRFGGGAIMIERSDDVNISNVTIVNNLSEQQVGGIVVVTGSVNMKNNIIANNIGLTESQNDCDISSGANFISNGYNILENNSSTCSEFTHPTDRVGVEPTMLPLADNGGKTKTLALPNGSIALNSGSCSDNSGNPISLDQRGMQRGQVNCDVGAFEAVFEQDILPVVYYILLN